MLFEKLVRFSDSPWKLLPSWSLNLGVCCDLVGYLRTCIEASTVFPSLPGGCPWLFPFSGRLGGSPRPQLPRYHFDETLHVEAGVCALVSRSRGTLARPWHSVGRFLGFSFNFDYITLEHNDSGTFPFADGQYVLNGIKCSQRSLSTRLSLANLWLAQYALCLFPLIERFLCFR